MDLTAHLVLFRVFFHVFFSSTQLQPRKDGSGAGLDEVQLLVTNGVPF